MIEKALSKIIAALLLASILTLALNLQLISPPTLLNRNFNHDLAVEWRDQSTFDVSHQSLHVSGFNTVQNHGEKELLNPSFKNKYVCAWNTREGWDFDEMSGWEDFAKMDSDSLEVIVGLNSDEVNSYEQVKILIRKNGGQLTDIICVDNTINAVVADLPLEAASFFTEEVLAAGLSRYIEPNIKYKLTFTPNDPEWTKQWGPSKIEADWAWNTTTGASSVLVAVIDTGIDYDHPDLEANYLAGGYDWVDNDPYPMDDYGHGTHCAGIIAATINNNIGVAGLAQVRIMAERALSAEGGYASDLANAIIHAVDRGADILSNSWGGFVYSMLIHEAIQYAYSRGVLVVASAGNEKTSQQAFPAANPEVVAVTATDEYDNPASFNNYGDWVELAAPGVDIYSTLWDNGYGYMGGTSMACPHVAGVAALAWSQFPGASRDWMRLWLQYTADDLGASGFDPYYGYGRVNARVAVEGPLPEHDVLISSWDKPAYVEPEESAVVNTKVLNFGAENETGVLVRLMVNGSVVNSTTISFLETGKSVTVSRSWTPTAKGICNITSQVVPVSGETMIENNAASAPLFVGTKTMKVPTHLPTIQKAVDAAGSGFTILVESGTYIENVVVDKSISLVGANRDNTTIRGGGEGMVVHIIADNCNVSGFTIKSSGDDWPCSGVVLDETSNCSVYNNHVKENCVGILLWDCSNCSVSGNNATGNSDYGIQLYDCSDCSVSNNIVTKNFDHGIQLTESISCFVSDNTVNDNYNHGVWLNFSSSCSLLSNNVTCNHDDGVLIQGSSSCVLTSNNLTGNGYNLALEAEGVQHYIHEIDASNLVDGKPVYYWVNEENEKVPETAGYVAIVNSTNIKVENLTAKNNRQGVLLVKTTNSTIQNVTVENNVFGIQLYDSSSCSVFNNNAKDNDIGVALQQSSNCSVSENTVNGNGVGIKLNECSDSSVIGNNATENNYGIKLVCSGSNRIVRNSLLGNTVQVAADGYSNIWDDGYPGGGNYWSDHSTEDLYSGPSQNETGGDGIADTPYNINQYNQDEYPLTKPYENFGHDIAVLNVTTSETQIAGAEKVNVTVKVKNLEDIAETFQVTVYYNDSVVEAETVTYLIPGENRTLTFTWNPIGVPPGNYTIKAEVNQVRGETVLANNLFLDGVVEIIPVHNVAVASVTPSKTIVGKGYAVAINVTALNKGTFTETFNVTAYVNTTLLGTQNITLVSGCSNTLTFTWQTTGVAYGNYTVKANASMVAEETNIDDNEYIDGSIQVSIVGDLNGDCLVDMRDIAPMAAGYGAELEDPEYVANYDLNSDGVIDMKDIAPAAARYGETC